MKTIAIKSLVFMLFCLVFTSNIANAQKEVSTEISYKVDFGLLYPIEGTSNQIIGKASLDDSTGELKKLSFDVDINSFIGQHAGYLGWIANSWENPKMSFSSTSITKKDNELVIEGTLQFRRRSSFVELTMTQKETDNSIVIKGDFSLNTNDYFTITPHHSLVPTWIPFKLTLVFDKDLKKEMTTIN